MNSMFYKAGTWEVSLGRWGILLVDRLKNGFVSPVISTIISIFIMSVVAMIIVMLFGMKKKGTVILSSIAIVSMPAFSDVLTYWYCSDSYSLAMLFSVLAVYIIYKIKPKIKSWKGYLFGALALVIQMGLYQSFIGITTTLSLFIIIIEILKNERSFKEIIKLFKDFIIMGILGAVIYYGISEIALSIFRVSIADYRGASNVSVMSILTNLPSSIKNTYNNFIEYYFGNGIIHNDYWNRQFMNLFLMWLIVGGSIYIIIKNKVYKDRLNIVFLLICFCILPICLDIIQIIVTKTDVELMILPAYIVPIIFTIYIINILSFEDNISNILKYGIYIITLLITITYICSDNATYMTLKIKNNQAYSNIIRAIDRIETSEEYDKNMKIMLAGTIEKYDYKVLYKMANGGVSEYNNFWMAHGQGMKKFVEINLGIDINLCTGKQYGEIIQTEEFQNMGIFPDKDSVKVINNIMVVKFTNMF